MKDARIRCRVKGCNRRFRPSRIGHKYCSEGCRTIAHNTARKRPCTLIAKLAALEKAVSVQCIGRGYTWNGYEELPTGISKAKLKIECYQHGEFVPASAYAFTQGRQGCPDCAGKVFNYAYVSVLNDGAVDRCIKFGVSSNPSERLKISNINNPLTATHHAVYYFEDRDSCKKAEKACIGLLECGVIPKWELPDGYTETTHLRNVERVMKIFEQFGGVRQL